MAVWWRSFLPDHMVLGFSLAALWYLGQVSGWPKLCEWICVCVYMCFFLLCLEFTIYAGSVLYSQSFTKRHLVPGKYYFTLKQMRINNRMDSTNLRITRETVEAHQLAWCFSYAMLAISLQHRVNVFITELVDHMSLSKDFYVSQLFYLWREWIEEYF